MMRGLVMFVLASMFFLTEIKAQCPVMQDFELYNFQDHPDSVCGPVEISSFVRVFHRQRGSYFEFYKGSSPDFNPLAGEGDLILRTDVPGIPAPVQGRCPQEISAPGRCPNIHYVTNIPCASAGSVADNGYIVFNSGAGFYASDIQLQFDQQLVSAANPVNNHIQVGNNPCLLQEPSVQMLNNLRSVAACASDKIFPVGPNGIVPADAIVVLFTSSNASGRFDFSTLCEGPRPVFVLQSACSRTLEAFPKDRDCNAATRKSSYILGLRDCDCRHELIIDRCGIIPNEGLITYVYNNTNPAETPPEIVFGADFTVVQNPCRSPRQNFWRYLDFFGFYAGHYEIPLNSPDCHKTFFFKVVLYNPGTSCPPQVTEAERVRMIGCTYFELGSAPSEVCSEDSFSVDLFTMPGSTTRWFFNSTNLLLNLNSGSTEGNRVTFKPVSLSDRPIPLIIYFENTDRECTTLDSIVINIMPKPYGEIKGVPEFCPGSRTVLTAESFAYTSLLWSTGVAFPEITVENEGLYSVTWFSNQCSYTDSIVVNLRDSLSVSIVGDTMKCVGSTILLRSSEIFQSYEWSTGSNSSTIVAGNPGTYSLKVRNGECYGRAVFVLRDFQLPNVQSMVTMPRCFNQASGEILIKIDYTDSIKFTWSDGDTSIQRKDLLHGDYPFKIVYGRNCSLEDTISLLNPPDAAAVLKVNGAGCIPGELGSVQINGIVNGQPPFELSFDGVSLGSIPTVIGDLMVGVYPLKIEDANGCVFEQIVQIAEGIPFEIVLPDTVALMFQKTAVIPLNINPQLSNLIFSWDPPRGLSCVTCARPSITALAPGWYQLVAQSPENCTDSAGFYLEIIPEQPFSVPNAFTPDGNQVNDNMVLLTSTQGIYVHDVLVHDRWGKEVFRTQNFYLDKVAQLWDGTINGLQAPGDNYTYYVKATLPDGSDVIQRGSILLIR